MSADQQEKPIIRLVVSNGFHQRQLIAKYGGKFSGKPKNLWRIPVADGYVVNQETGECFDPLPFRDHLTAGGAQVAIVRAR